LLATDQPQSLHAPLGAVAGQGEPLGRDECCYRPGAGGTVAQRVSRLDLFT